MIFHSIKKQHNTTLALETETLNMVTVASPTKSEIGTPTTTVTSSKSTKDVSIPKKQKSRFRLGRTGGASKPSPSPTRSRSRSSSRPHSRAASPTKEYDPKSSPTKSRKKGIKKLLSSNPSTTPTAPSGKNKLKVNDNKKEDVEAKSRTPSPKKLPKKKSKSPTKRRTAPSIQVPDASSTDSNDLLQEVLINEKRNGDLQNRGDWTRLEDGFCRRVSSYDGQTISVNGTPTYEVGNYLGGGVAGVVYEGARLRPISEYPHRKLKVNEGIMPQNPLSNPATPLDKNGASFNESNRNGLLKGDELEMEKADDDYGGMKNSNSVLNLLTCTPSDVSVARDSKAKNNDIVEKLRDGKIPPEISNVVLDQNDQGESDTEEDNETVAIKVLNPVGFRLLSSAAANSAVIVHKGDPMTDSIKRGLEPMTENHVWWLVNPGSKNLRALQRQSSSSLKVDASTGQVLGTSKQQKQARSNSNQSGEVINSGELIDRGSPSRGIRLSLVAAYLDPKKDNMLSELPLDKCVEIWGHAPFGVSEDQFQHIIDSIERVNAGQPKKQISEKSFNGTQNGSMVEMSVAFDSPPHSPQKLSGLYRAALVSEQERYGNIVYCEDLNAYITLPTVPPKYLRWLRQRRAATKEIRNMMLIGRHKNVVHLYEVMELIQQTKSTMFLVLELVRGGELFDLISSGSAAGTSKKDKKKKNNAKTEDETRNSKNEISGNDSSEKEDSLLKDLDSEETMKNFFYELCSGIAYCHWNGIAHRDLKPENLLVHHSGKNVTLKIADFGLSATFVANQQQSQQDHDPYLEPALCAAASTTCSPLSSSVPSKSLFKKCQQMATEEQDAEYESRHNFANGRRTENGSNARSTFDKVPSDPQSYIERQMNTIQEIGTSALSFLTCGNLTHVYDCLGPADNKLNSEQYQKELPLRRMTSIVGSPHYVAPEIISQSTSNHHLSDSDKSKKNKNRDNNSVPDIYKAVSNYGYDGTKADVWSAGVILYAMLFRSLPFGEDLLRCPRYKSFFNWYEEARRIGTGRRCNAESALQPINFGEDDDDDCYDLGPHWFFPSYTSIASRDLIVAMLNPDPFHRLSIDQVLVHPWLENLSQQRT